MDLVILCCADTGLMVRRYFIEEIASNVQGFIVSDLVINQNKNWDKNEKQNNCWSNFY